MFASTSSCPFLSEPPPPPTGSSLSRLTELLLLKLGPRWRNQRGLKKNHEIDKGREGTLRLGTTVGRGLSPIAPNTLSRPRPHPHTLPSVSAAIFVGPVEEEEEEEGRVKERKGLTT